mmetsp:Transcript_14626/g.27757  ORF Transcript_14626/g.27757 Transcript_14626/m.27757 type:complete len:297 (-) Transcript_14626:164-1054(-)
MASALRSLFDESRGFFPTAVSKNIQGSPKISSDSLHLLAYLNPGDLPRRSLESIVRASGSLETSIGYMTRGSPIGGGGYHIGNVWPFEQAVIYAGALRHNLSRPLSVTSRISKVMDPADSARPYPEYFVPRNTPGSTQTSFGTQNNAGTQHDVVGATWQAAGCEVQLWSVAASLYFRSSLKIRGYPPCPTCEPYATCASGGVQAKFECKGLGGGTKRVPCDRLNDDYCDCEYDGFDEPATAACSRVRKGPLAEFRCKNGDLTYLSRLGDGLQDCGDGSDEELVAQIATAKGDFLAL